MVEPCQAACVGPNGVVPSHEKTTKPTAGWTIGIAARGFPHTGQAAVFKGPFELSCSCKGAGQQQLLHQKRRTPSKMFSSDWHGVYLVLRQRSFFQLDFHLFAQITELRTSPVESASCQPSPKWLPCASQSCRHPILGENMATTSCR